MRCRTRALCATLAALSLASCSTMRPVSAHDPGEFGIERLTSTGDRDADGIDDQTDILASARAYVATRPRYGSAYYEGGRPDDGRGVCTDVVDQALLGAGYDLRELIDADVRASPESYPGIVVPDPDIDFRRVANQVAWLTRNAVSLTTDPDDLASWQGGDIVAWDNHVGVVSDLRDARGHALVIHHASALQPNFEDDALVSVAFGPIRGHWRMVP